MDKEKCPDCGQDKHIMDIVEDISKLVEELKKLLKEE